MASKIKDLGKNKDRLKKKNRCIMKEKGCKRKIKEHHLLIILFIECPLITSKRVVRQVNVKK